MCVCVRKVSTLYLFSLLIFCSVCMHTCVGVGVGVGGYVCAKSQHCTSFL